LKGLPPALRKKRRYIAFRLISESEANSSVKTDFELKDVANAILHTVMSLFGDYCGMNTGVWVEEFNNGYGILRCNRDEVDKVKVALTLTCAVNGVNVIPVILGVSGTLKKCRSKYIGGVKNAHAANGL
jgi:ribonuclease P/MRP protein subunit POP5